jgi:threonine/homoserine/homoserine lactone efflux protein
MAMTFIVFVIYGIGAASVRRHLIDRPHVVQRVRRVFAGSFVGLGIKLATTSR